MVWRGERRGREIEASPDPFEVGEKKKIRNVKRRKQRMFGNTFNKTSIIMKYKTTNISNSIADFRLRTSDLFLAP
jgi:hypothetical protein